jgi:hypothetical protein
MFQVDICSQQLEICKSVCMIIVLVIALWRLINFRLFCSDDCRPNKIGSYDMKQTYSSIIIVSNVCVLTSESMIVYLFFTRLWSAIIGTKQPKVSMNQFCWAIILMWCTRNIFLLASDILFINWTVCMNDNLPERFQVLSHAHIICNSVREDRIICCQIFWDLLLKSAFQRIFYFYAVNFS